MRTRDNGAVLVLGLSNKMIPREAVTLQEVTFWMREVIGAETTGSNGVVLSRGRKSAKACIQYLSETPSRSHRAFHFLAAKHPLCCLFLRGEKRNGTQLSFID